MRALALLAVTLAGCASMHGPLDVITPDEFTFGQGNTTSSLTGDVDTYWSQEGWPVEMDGEAESTYAALTWDIPTWEGQDGGMDRQTQRKLSLLIDQMVEEEVEAEDGLLPTLADGSKPPPMWLPFGLIGVGVIIMLGFALFSRRREQW